MDKDKKENKTKDDETKAIVTIRGLDKNLYLELMSLAKQAGKTIGEVINEAMELLISLGEGVIATGEKFKESLESTLLVQISDIEDLTLTRRDLLDSRGQLLVRKIKKLVISKDIDEDIFDKKIRKIISVQELHIPKTLSKIKVLSKSSKIKRIIEY